MPLALGVIVPPDLSDETFLPYLRRADSLGFAQAWVVEDCFLRGGIAQAAIALASTPRITVGLGILPAGARNVAFAAMEIATLARAFPGRLLVGIGHGMPDWMRQVGAWPASPLTLIDEYVTALRSILAGETTTLDGRYVQVHGVRLASPPSQPPPVFAGVRGPRSLAVSARVADGTILAEPVTPAYLAFVRQQWTDSMPGHQIVAYNVAAIDPSVDVARQQARTALAAVGDPDWAPHIRPLPFADELFALRAQCASRAEFAARMPDAWVDQLAIVGPPEAARRRLAELQAAGADHLVLAPAGPDPMLALESLGSVLQPG